MSPVDVQGCLYNQGTRSTRWVCCPSLNSHLVEPLAGTLDVICRSVHVPTQPVISCSPLKPISRFLHFTLKNPVGFSFLFSRSDQTGGRVVLQLRHAAERGRCAVLDLTRSTRQGPMYMYRVLSSSELGSQGHAGKLVDDSRNFHLNHMFWSTTPAQQGGH